MYQGAQVISANIGWIGCLLKYGRGHPRHSCARGAELGRFLHTSLISGSRRAEPTQTMDHARGSNLCGRWRRRRLLA